MNISVFDVVGPIMVGPSSSHTAGANRLARVARLIAGGPFTRVSFGLCGSFARTYRGHGTDKALVAGALGLREDDGRLSESFALAAEAGISFDFYEADLEGYHENTAIITFYGDEEETGEIIGSSTGGGGVLIRSVNGFETEFTAQSPTLVILQHDRKGVLSRITHVLAENDINIGVMKLSRKTKGSVACCIIETDSALSPEVALSVGALEDVISARAINLQIGGAPEADGAGPSGDSATPGPSGDDGEDGETAGPWYESIADLLRLSSAAKTPLWQIILENESRLTGLGAEEVFRRLDEHYEVMIKAAGFTAVGAPEDSRSLIRGMSALQLAYAGQGEGVSGALINSVMAKALSCSELNASMGKICAAPTAGACGVLPAVLTAMGERYGWERRHILEALLTAAGVGAVITANATVSGARGGCQAECGSAAAMAAAAAVYLAGGTPEMSAHACGIALIDAMGLICDPVAGLVQFPCALRNASQAVNALISADLALAGSVSVIPPDEVIQAMYRVGLQLPPALKETAMGGVAASPAAREIENRLLKPSAQLVDSPLPEDLLGCI